MESGVKAEVRRGGHRGGQPGWKGREAGEAGEPEPLSEWGQAECWAGWGVQGWEAAVSVGARRLKK